MGRPSSFSDLVEKLDAFYQSAADAGDEHAKSKIGSARTILTTVTGMDTDAPDLLHEKLTERYAKDEDLRAKLGFLLEWSEDMRNGAYDKKSDRSSSASSQAPLAPYDDPSTARRPDKGNSFQKLAAKMSKTVKALAKQPQEPQPSAPPAPATWAPATPAPTDMPAANHLVRLSHAQEPLGLHYTYKPEGGVVVVAGVIPGSAAARHGVPAGRLLEVNGEKVTTNVQLHASVAAAKAAASPNEEIDLMLRIVPWVETLTEKCNNEAGPQLEDEEACRRLKEFYEKHRPDKVGGAPRIWLAYNFKPNTLLASLVQNNGGDKVRGDLAWLQEYCDQHGPDQALSKEHREIIRKLEKVCLNLDKGEARALVKNHVGKECELANTLSEHYPVEDFSFITDYADRMDARKTALGVTPPAPSTASGSELPQPQQAPTPKPVQLRVIQTQLAEGFHELSQLVDAMSPDTSATAAVAADGDGVHAERLRSLEEGMDRVRSLCGQLTGIVQSSLGGGGGGAASPQQPVTSRITAGVGQAATGAATEAPTPGADRQREEKEQAEACRSVREDPNVRERELLTKRNEELHLQIAELQEEQKRVRDKLAEMTADDV